MRNQYSPWEELASLPHIELRRESPGEGRLGEYVHHLSLIRLDPAMPRRQARAVLCHELRHHEFEDVITCCDWTNARQEYRADSTAARLLVNLHDLADALIVCEHNLAAAAIELRVSTDVVQTRIERLHPSERGYLKGRLTQP